ncbi:MAG: folate-binding protein [Pseudomonadota bacterium]
MQTPTDTRPVAASASTDFSGKVELTHMGIIRVAGDDAAAFLQGQLTQDVVLLGTHQARLAAFCNAKGRMQASFIVVKRAPDDILLVLSHDVLAATLKRLSMFVMRAKAKLTDASEDFQLIGLTGSVAEAAAGTREPWHKKDIDAAHVVSLYPGAGVARAFWCGPVSQALPAGPTLQLAVWHWLSVQSGIAMISQPIFEAFVPQMLNYESVGGVNFKKGCYPGQEIVARSQFRGTLKRRAYLAHASAAVATGQEVFHAADSTQPCGLVAAAAPAPAGGFDAIVSIQTSAADAAASGLNVGGPQGPVLTLLPLPYPLLEDI